MYGYCIVCDLNSSEKASKREDSGPLAIYSSHPDSTDQTLTSSNQSDKSSGYEDHQTSPTSLDPPPQLSKFPDTVTHTTTITTTVQPTKEHEETTGRHA